MSKTNRKFLHCIVSTHLAGNCATCAKRADPAHLAYDRIYCASCCPIHGAPLIAAAGASGGSQ